eukprot:TRINITY_DN660_c0_g1_i1.p1 TRINITY_DN660_c0_g1~~TRINITY_DN660_c0_g1_i1.p1  ORF type:complete len:126 (+),score=16.66 TRINITY_DN660_c0_g1_i1:1270-1647(+)
MPLHTQEQMSVIELAQDIKAYLIRHYNKPATSFTTWPNRQHESPNRHNRPKSMGTSPEGKRRTASSIEKQIASMSAFKTRKNKGLRNPVPDCGIMAELSLCYSTRTTNKSNALPRSDSELLAIPE